MTPKSLTSDLIRGWHRFSEKIMLHQNARAQSLLKRLRSGGAVPPYLFRTRLRSTAAYLTMGIHWRICEHPLRANRASSLIMHSFRADNRR